MKYNQVYIFSLFILAFASPGFSQKVKVWSEPITLQTWQIIMVTKEEFNGLTLIFEGVFPEGLIFETMDGAKILVARDGHMTDRIQSNLIFLDKAVKEFKLTSTTDLIGLRAVYQYVPSISLNDAARTGFLNCEEPAYVPQSLWRAGLEDPVPGRTSTSTRHCIVHHSASSNSDTNSINLVRAFYIQHKDVNGWDDIGYNFLIGHDGTIFAGRDPEKPEISQDNVFGAHFCGKNSYTMGICVIGNFDNAPPDVRAISSLERLMTWKMFKDDMQPLDSMHHPDTINSDFLPVLAGHRSGCATACPGQLLFDQLPELRLKIEDNLALCAPLSNDKITTINGIQVAPNPSSGSSELLLPVMNLLIIRSWI